MPSFPENYSLFNFQENMDLISRKITNTVNIHDIVIKRTNNYIVATLRPIRAYISRGRKRI